MTSEENMREEYEKFTGKSWHCHLDMTNRIIWEKAWKASRESLVIRVNSAACHDATAGDVLDAIENSGIKWEVEQ